MDKSKNKMLGLVCLLSIILAFVGGLFFGKTFNSAKVVNASTNDELSEVISLVKNNYYGTISDDEIQKAYLDGTISNLCDKYSHIDYTKSSSSLSLGISMSYDYVITNVITTSTAYKKGLRVNDVVVGINDLYTKNSSIKEITSEVSLKENAKNIFHIKRDSFYFDLELIPEKIEYDFFETKKIGSIGYIKLDSFNDGASEIFINNLEKLEKQNITGLVIDLRNNPGGSVDEVVTMLREFLTGNKVFLQLHDKNSKFDTYFRPTKNEAKPYDIKILINNNTASCSEVFALAMNRIMNYELIGTTTFGKGVYQTGYTLTSNKDITLWITTGVWYGYDEESINQVGVKPTYEIDYSPYYYAHKGDDNTYTVDMASEAIKNVEVMLNYLGYSVRMDGYFDNDLKDIIQTKYSKDYIDKDIQASIYNDFMEKFNKNDSDIALDKAISLF